MEKKEKKYYQSKQDYGKKWNKSNINVSLNRKLVENLKTKIVDQSLKSFIEGLIKKYLNE